MRKAFVIVNDESGLPIGYISDKFAKNVGDVTQSLDQFSRINRSDFFCCEDVEEITIFDTIEELVNNLTKK